MYVSVDLVPKVFALLMFCKLSSDVVTFVPLIRLEM